MFEKFKVPKDLMPQDPRFGVGPSLIPLSHLQSLAATGSGLLGTSHRQLAVRNLVKEIQDGLTQYFNLPTGYEVVLGNGGATLLWDMIGLGLVEKSSVHFTCGEFSEKWYKSHKLIPWIHADQIRVESGKGINPREVEGHDFICATLNETSTGVMLTDLPLLKNAQTLMSLDATSGAGQMAVDFNRVDVFYFSPQKVFAAEGGLFIAIMSPKAIARAQKISQDKTRFIPESFKWTHAIENSKLNQTYNTPSISNLFLLNEQIKLMNKVGLKNVIKLAQKKAELVYRWADSKPYLHAYIKEEEFRSTAVATIDVDQRYSVENLAQCLRSQNAALDIEGYRKLGRNQLRIGMFHNIAYEDLEKLTKIISLGIESL